MSAVPVSPPAATACDGALVRAFGFLGKRWNGIVIGTLLHGPQTFSGVRRAIPAISESVLSARLAELTAAGLIHREVTEGPPVSVTYSLTRSGEALVPVLHQLAGWARAHLPDAAAPCPGGEGTPG